MNQLLVSLSLATYLAACSSGSASSASAPGDAGSDRAPLADAASHDAADAGSGDGGDESGPGTGTGSITGTYGMQSIAPIAAAYWVGKPVNPAESGGGPYIYLFSKPLTCAEISIGNGWIGSITSGTQVLELIVGTTQTGTAVHAASHAAANGLEANWAISPSGNESRATSGTVTLTAYVPGSHVDEDGERHVPRRECARHLPRGVLRHGQRVLTRPAPSHVHGSRQTYCAPSVGLHCSGPGQVFAPEALHVMRQYDCTP